VAGKCKNACDPPPLTMEGVKCNDGQNIAKAFDIMMPKPLNNVNITSDPILSKDNFNVVSVMLIMYITL
jgi:hypothetical protein